VNLRDYLTFLLPKTIGFRLARVGLLPPLTPSILTLSVTAACQSRCKTCKIGEMWLADPARSKADLSLEELEKIFKNIGRIYMFNVSGGEPFLRKDIPEIIRLACLYLKPKIIHIPTNAILPERIRDLVVESLRVLDDVRPGVVFTVKPSIDGVGEVHDRVRGVRGNFRKLERTIALLEEVARKHGNFHLELGTVISNFNKDDLQEVEDYVHRAGVQSYRNEIAEQRAEFFNVGDDITPDADTYESLIEGFSRKIRDNMRSKRKLARITESLRLVYYELVVKILRERRQVIPCLGGISNVHINFDGEVWPCCVLGYDKPMGSLRAHDYDFHALLRSSQAGEARKYIRDGNCACPLANQWYSNILSSPKYLFKAAVNFVRYG
jgi:MoaA/NifB/PqqE/SkfB family radical SAM enzyme